jgi:CRP-like cAMP-binding protein
MNKARFLSALRGSPPLQRGLDGYIHKLMGQISQTAACNRFHDVEARLARWLLMTRDRVGAAEFPMTQRFLSHMLGVRRVGVSEAASAFQRRKLIEYRWGEIKILDHRGLEAAACSCYAGGSALIAPWRPGVAAGRQKKRARVRTATRAKL